MLTCRNQDKTLIFTPKTPVTEADTFSFRLAVSTMKRLVSAYNLETVNAVQWGVLHEEVAMDEYKKLGGSVQPTGIVNQ